VIGSDRELARCDLMREEMKKELGLAEEKTA
jgi:hypothetical protein